MSKNSAETDFVRNPHRTILSLSIPVLFAMIAEPLTGLADTFFVKELGESAQAALGIGTVALSSSFWVFSFLGVGTQTEVAQAIGKNDSQRTRQIVSISLALAVAISLIVIVLMNVFAPSIARALGATDVSIVEAVAYVRARMIGAPAVLMMMVIMGALRGKQQMQTTLYLAVGINIMNVLLDRPLIFGWGVIPAFGVAGAGVASSMSQWLGVIAGLFVIRRQVGFSRDIRWRDARKLLVVGSDLFVRTGTLSLYLMFATRIANQAGEAAGAAHQAIRQISFFAALFLDAFAVTAQSLIGYFVGAGDWKTAKDVARVCIGWAIGTGVALSAVFLASQTWVAHAFVTPSAHPEFYSAWGIATIGLGVSAIAFLTDGVHWGTGDYRFLRNVMLISSVIAGSMLLLINRTALADNALFWIWAFTMLWSTVRAILGLLRVWPGIWNSPFVTNKYE
ncbi:MAG: MATE family efflux transporter [Candidatus Promineifilaceae bacterium]